MATFTPTLLTMYLQTAELLVCPPYHQQIVCGEDPFIFLFIIF